MSEQASSKYDAMQDSELDRLVSNNLYALEVSPVPGYRAILGRDIVIAFLMACELVMQAPPRQDGEV